MSAVHTCDIEPRFAASIFCFDNGKLNAEQRDLPDGDGNATACFHRDYWRRGGRSPPVGSSSSGCGMLLVDTGLIPFRGITTQSNRVRFREHGNEPSRTQLSVRPYTRGQFNKPKGNFYSSLIEAIALARPTSSATVLDFIMKRMQGRQQ